MSSKGSRRRPSAAMIVAVAALVVAMAGSAVAQQQIGTRDIQPRAVTGGKIAQGAVIGPKIKNRAIRANKMRDGSVGPRIIRNNAVGPRKIRDGSVRTSKLADDAVTGPKLAPQAVGSRNLLGAFTHRFEGGLTLPAEECVRNEIEAPGVQAGDHALVTPNASVDPGLLASADTGENQVGLRVCNVTEDQIQLPELTGSDDPEFGILLIR